MLEAVLVKLQAKLFPGWVLIQVNFDPIQEIGPKVGGEYSFVSGLSFTRLRYLQEEVCSFTGRLRETCYQLGTGVPFSQGPQIAFPIPTNSSWNVLMTLKLILTNHCVTCCVYCHCFVLLEDAD